LFTDQQMQIDITGHTWVIPKILSMTTLSQYDHHSKHQGLCGHS